MAEFSLTTLFVVPVGDTVPTTGSTDALTVGKTGVYLNTYAVATAGNVANAPYIYVAQGKQEPYLTGTKKSDKIAKTHLVSYYKSIGGGSALNQITTIGNLVGKCGEQINVTLRLTSYYIDLAFANGLTRSVSVQTPCCDCGAAPCETLSADDHEALITEIAAKITAEPLLSQHVTAVKSGVGLSAIVTITGKPVKNDNGVGHERRLDINPFHQDRLIFRTYVQTSPATTADFEADAMTYGTACSDAAGTVTVTQRSTFGPKNTAAEVRQIQEYLHSYQSIHKNLFTDPGYNQTYEDFVVNGTIYDLHYIKFREYGENGAWEMKEPIDSTIIVAIPQGNNAALATILSTYLGAPDTSGNNVNADTAIGSIL